MRLIEVEDVNEVLLTRLFIGARIGAEDNGLNNQQYLGDGLHLQLTDDIENEVVRELLGFRTYRTREQIVRVLERLMGWVSDKDRRWIDLVGLWSTIAKRHLVDRHPFLIRSAHYESWRRHMHGLDEDTPGLCLLVHSHAQEITSRSKLSDRIYNWPTYLRGDQGPLYQELSKGFACLHLHLAASYPAPYFWVGLMNNRFNIADALPDSTCLPA